MTHCFNLQETMDMTCDSELKAEGDYIDSESDSYNPCLHSWRASSAD